MGPGWDVGKPRLGYLHEIPDVSHYQVDLSICLTLFSYLQIERPVDLYDPPMNLLEKAYTLIHFPLVVLFYHELSMRNMVLSQQIITCGVIVLLLSLTSVGFLMEKRWFAPMLEFVRCLTFFAVEQMLWPVVESLEFFSFNRILLIYAIRITFLVSALGCGLVSLHRLSVWTVSRMNERKMKIQ